MSNALGFFCTQAQPKQNVLNQMLRMVAAGGLRQHCLHTVEDGAKHHVTRNIHVGHT